ncbi:efflux RND transporter periplasmic adaptor subunit [Microbulbifer litoralis]|uniref:efflux RND transporter periplasmic adaptor subunit n=1 Tax=Microbulbifer litoralis TaxID=2933965 RepID=UPI00202850EC|nr:efflux RND transporter periplasmic adaptor subunit [Microbulbifer sp. GX H0434]
MVRSLTLTGIAAAALALAACSPPEADTGEQPRPAIVVQPQQAGVEREIYPGEVRARYEPDLAFRIGGKISRRLVQVGDRVNRGDPLAELNAEDLQLELDGARAQLDSAQADQRLASNERQRHRSLLERQLVSQSQFDTVESRYDASTAQLERARANLEVARNRAGYAVLKAPRDGVIARRQAEAGQVVAAGQTVFTLAADGDREVRIDLPEQQIDRFAVGQTVTLELWSRPGEPFNGQIRELSPAADPASRTFEARVAFDNEKVKADLGQSARVFADTGERHGALSIPLAALTADNGNPFVWVLDPDGNTLHKTPVTVGAFGTERVPVLDGLAPDNWVVAAGTQLLRDGQRVRPVDRMNRPVEIESSQPRQN